MSILSQILTKLAQHKFGLQQSPKDVKDTASCMRYGRGLLVATNYYYLTEIIINQNQEVAH